MEKKLPNAPKPGQITLQPVFKMTTKGADSDDPSPPKKRKAISSRESLQRKQNVEAVLQKQIPRHATHYVESLDKLDREQETAKFIIEMESSAREPRVPAQRLLKAKSTFKSTNGIALDLAEFFAEGGSLDPDILKLTENELGRALGSSFTVPIVVQGFRNVPEGALDTHLGKLERRNKDVNGSMFASVYDHRDSCTTRTSIPTLVRNLRSNATRLNYLDIENRDGIPHIPSQVAEADLRTQINANWDGDIGKTGSKWQPEIHKEFYLGSLALAVSTIHVDSGAPNTWVLILENRKIWYFNRDTSARSSRWLAKRLNEHVEGYADDWVKLELRAGDLLIMPPGTAHAVFTPEKCFAVGGTFYTAAHLGRSLEALSFQETHPEISNELLGPLVYDNLAYILDALKPKTNFLDTRQRASVVASQDLFKRKLSEKEIIAMSEMKGQEKTALVKARDRFLSRLNAFAG